VYSDDYSTARIVVIIGLLIGGICARSKARNTRYYGGVPNQEWFENYDREMFCYGLCIVFAIILFLMPYILMVFRD
jgi:hypothetical protein